MCLISDDILDCGGLPDELEAETTDAETESEGEEDIVLVEKKRVKSAFVDDEAEVSDDDEGSGDDEDSIAEVVSLDTIQVKSTCREDDADEPGDRNKNQTLPAGEQGIIDNRRRKEHDDVYLEINLSLNFLTPVYCLIKMFCTAMEPKPTAIQRFYCYF
jgi:hypothetical protein